MAFAEYRVPKRLFQRFLALAGERAAGLKPRSLLMLSMSLLWKSDNAALLDILSFALH